MTGTLYDDRTLFPQGFDPQKAGAYFITSGVSLANADFSFANLHRANLSGANLSGANLKATNISGANLKDAKMPESLSN